MYICICNAIRERDLRDAARQHGDAPEKLYERLGCRVQCGQCLDDAEEVIAEARDCVPA